MFKISTLSQTITTACAIVAAVTLVVIAAELRLLNSTVMSEAESMKLAFTDRGVVGLSYPPLSMQQSPMYDTRQLVGRSWGPEQATGQPNTNQMEDMETAWAPLSTDGQKEWLELSYEPIDTAEILIYETYNPGSITKVTAFVDGKEQTVWQGKGLSSQTEGGVQVAHIPLEKSLRTDKIKLYLDSPSVPGWNEIDAVGLREKANTDVIHWATSAVASTTYAEPDYSSSQRVN